MADLPKRVEICEEGPREGFQSGPPVATRDKVRLIDALATTGLRQINCTSFVDARWVPQMADAEKVATAISRRPGVRYTCLWLNERGFQRALASGLDLAPSILCSVSSTMALKNNGCTGPELIRKQGKLIDLYRQHGLRLEYAHVSTAFGCCYEGTITAQQTIATVAALLEMCDEHGTRPQVIYFSDTVGAATPLAVARVLDQARTRWPDQTFALHLHDTRGMGLANVYAGLQLGISRFDASCGGLGGCPFSGSQGATGNICTEDLALMCEEMGIATGLDLDALVECARLAESIVGRALPGKFMKAGRIGKAAALSAAG